MYPATYGEHIAGKGDIIPDNLSEFIEEIANEYTKKGYDDVRIWYPNTIPISAERTLSEEPYGEWKHYEARQQDRQLYSIVKTAALTESSVFSAWQTNGRSFDPSQSVWATYPVMPQQYRKQVCPS